jgi:hypothetical protein
MSRRSSARVAALLSAVALALGATAATTITGPAVNVAGVCCSGHK